MFSAEFRDYDSDEIPDDDEDEYEIEKEEVLNATVRIERNTWPCHKNKTLYILQQNVFAEKFIYGVRHNSSRYAAWFFRSESLIIFRSLQMLWQGIYSFYLYELAGFYHPHPLSKPHTVLFMTIIYVC